ncbi:hypothetical protein [Alkalicoccobacillus gibsonii]|uniref:hypothetical protein n=1 Tax=Alkalicoccobacillus gibsonii TaxID=79881 RepID=UPI001933637F|nr:hypothetical protein [Alkalicoccobacillus gibsonii]MBM0066777.1 hypothetical protein [Alkalicoccobacillus gibsonii]
MGFQSSVFKFDDELLRKIQNKYKWSAVTAEGAEVNSHPISDDSEMKLMAFETGVNLHIPSTIRGINTNPAIH